MLELLKFIVETPANYFGTIGLLLLLSVILLGVVSQVSDAIQSFNRRR